MVDNSHNLFDFSFDDFSHENGITYWWASEFMLMLGYPNMASFIKPIHRAMQACLTANIDPSDNFIKISRVIDGQSIDDYKVTRFGCYMVAMNADSKKENVAKAQAYFADQVEKINLLLEGKEDIERLQIRDEIKEGNKLLNSAAKAAGVVNYGLFTDAGYRGLYNKSIKDVISQKGLPKTSNLMDYMGRTELSANLFRITMTEERLKLEKIKSETAAIAVHKQVGNKVRVMVKESTGLNPEQLPVTRKISEVNKQLKKANKELNKKKK